MPKLQSDSHYQPSIDQNTVFTMPPIARIPTLKQTVLLFDLSLYGHHATYLRYLIWYWQQQQIAHRLLILVSPQFLTVHQDVVMLAQTGAAEISFVAITPNEAANLQPRSSRLKRNLRHWQEWDLYCRYARQLEATQSLVMYFDTYQLLLALGKTSPCPFSGIYFRPTFHYGAFEQVPGSRKAKLQRYWEYQSLQRVLRQDRLRWLFSLDCFAVDYLRQRHPLAKVVAIADPVEAQPTSTIDRDQFKQILGIDCHRRVGILFGALTPRKGIYPLLRAIEQLDREQANQFCLLLVGAANPTEQQKIQSEVMALRQKSPIQIVEQYEFVTEESIPNYFAISDIVLALYQRHVGMSGILLLAAAAQKPVLSTNYGLMGKLVSYHQLGLAVDSEDADAIANGLSKILQVEPAAICDFNRMAAFAQQNAWNTFAQTIIHHLGLD
jgi:glycosyltransferase involved in cell wall biosynthesis